MNTNETETTEYEAFLAELQFQRERAEACGVWPQEIFGALVCSNCEHYNDIVSLFCGMCGMLL